MNLLLARHGETEWNVAGRIQGWGNSPLTDRGVRQAEALAERLRLVTLAAAYASDLSRASETARIALTHHGIEALCMHDLRETSWGDWEGYTAEELDVRCPEMWRKFIERGSQTHPSDDQADWETTTLVPRGETLTAARTRIALAFAVINDAHGESDDWVLVVGHGGSLRFFITEALGLPPRAIRRFHLDNASLTHVKYYPNASPIVKFVNDSCHFAEVAP